MTIFSLCQHKSNTSMKLWRRLLISILLALFVIKLVWETQTISRTAFQSLFKIKISPKTAKLKIYLEIFKPIFKKKWNLLNSLKFLIKWRFIIMWLDALNCIQKSFFSKTFHLTWKSNFLNQNQKKLGSFWIHTIDFLYWRSKLGKLRRFS